MPFPKYSDIFVENRVFIAPAFDAPVTEGLRRNVVIMFLLLRLSERTPLERSCVHNMSPFVSSSGLSPGSREAKVQRHTVWHGKTTPWTEKKEPF